MLIQLYISLYMYMLYTINDTCMLIFAENVVFRNKIINNKKNYPTMFLCSSVFKISTSSWTFSYSFLAFVGVQFYLVHLGSSYQLTQQCSYVPVFSRVQLLPELSHTLS